MVGLLLALALLLACGGAQQPPGDDLDVRLDRESRADGEQLPARDDRAALEALYHATDGPNWIASDNWLSDAPLGQWLGVSTDASGRVTHLRFDDNGLSGEVPPELGNLTNLKVLELYDKWLSGEIPAELSNLTNLKVLEIYDNRLSGEIPPELGNLTRLDTLLLHENRLSGCVPIGLPYRDSGMSSC